MIVNARFVHINIVARDWKRLARFYEQVFGCVAVPPERELSGDWIDKATGLHGARIRGAHLRLPGCGDKWPTLEIFQYSPGKELPASTVNQPGFCHVAFAVDDVESARDAVIEAGGSALGKTVSNEIPGAGTIKFVYVTDPEGNIIELQKWS